MGENDLAGFIARLPKVELHVHLEGSIQPETLLTLAQRHGRALPASDLAGLREWYQFRDFDHFIEIYFSIANCLRDAEDIELIAREFLAGQAAQNIRYSEVTYSAYTQYKFMGIALDAQIAALERANAWALAALGTHMGLVVDIVRSSSPEEGLELAEWVIDCYHAGRPVVALGLGGAEVGNPPEKHAPAFARAREAGLPLVLHAGETVGPASIRGALEQGSVRIGHGVRCLEDPALVEELRARQVPLEVCPTSNICLKVFSSIGEHALPAMREAGLYLTINSDDPPLFNTTLCDEYRVAAELLGLDAEGLRELARDATRASFLPEAEKRALLTEIDAVGWG
jgi:adenosine deaminase